MEVTGRLIAAMPTKSGVSQKSGNQWMSREYVLEIPNGQYAPRRMAFTVFGEDRLKQFNLRKDEEVTIQFDIDAHEWNGRWFNEIRAYNVMRVGVAASVQQPMASSAEQSQMSVAAPPVDGHDDTLPF